MRPALIATLTFLGGCGYVGDPLPPALKIPLPVNDLGVKQVGSNLQVSFTVPAKTSEGMELTKLGGIELKIGPQLTPFDPDAWSGQAKTVSVAGDAPGKVEAAIPVSDWAGKEVAVAVRIANPKMRLSPWSNFVAVKVLAPIEKPANLRASATAAGVEVNWDDALKRPGVQWRIFRQGSNDKDPVELGVSPANRYTDAGADYDVPLKYTVVGFEGAALSETSEAVTITAVDSFAPIVPQGLSVLAGPSAVQLSWERNQENDLGMYRVYRSTGDEPFVKIAESPSAANYQDSATAAGRRYRYAVSAIDKKGNESPKSEAVEILLP